MVNCSNTYYVTQVFQVYLISLICIQQTLGLVNWQELP